MLSSLLLFINDYKGLFIVVQYSVYGFTIIAIKPLSLSNNVGGLYPSFFQVLDALLLRVHVSPKQRRSRGEYI